jgi:hypothetical protein
MRADPPGRVKRAGRIAISTILIPMILIPMILIPRTRR